MASCLTKEVRTKVSHGTGHFWMVPFCSPLVFPLLESAQFSGELYRYTAQVDWYAGTCMECEVTSVANIDRQTTEQGKERD